MELYQLKTFKLVAEEGHLTRAAKRLHASQPAVSGHIKTLEEELGVTLFLRTPKGMVLTPDGIKLKKYADQALSAVADMASYAEVLQKTVSGDLRLGLNSEPDVLRIAELFTEVKERCPALSIQLLQSMTGDILNKLEDDVLDAGFIYGVNESSAISTKCLKTFELALVGPAAWRDKLENCTLKELGGMPWILTPDDCPFNMVTSELFEKNGIKPDEVALVDQETTIRSMVKSGAGLSLILLDDVRNNPDAYCIFPTERLTMPLSIAYLERRSKEPIIKSLVSILSSIWQSLHQVS